MNGGRGGGGVYCILRRTKINFSTNIETIILMYLHIAQVSDIFALQRYHTSSSLL